MPSNYTKKKPISLYKHKVPSNYTKKKPISLYKHKMPSNYTKKIRLLFTNTRCSPITLKKSECSLGENKVASKYGLGM